MVSCSFSLVFSPWKHIFLRIFRCVRSHVAADLPWAAAGLGGSRSGLASAGVPAPHLASFQQDEVRTHARHDLLRPTKLRSEHVLITQQENVWFNHHQCRGNSARGQLWWTYGWWFCRVMADIDPQIMMKILMPGEIPVKSKRYPAILPKNHPVFMGQLPIFLAEKSQLCSNPTISLGKKKPMCQWFLFLLSRLQILAGCTPLWCWNPRHVYQWNPRCKSSIFRLNEAPQNNQDRTALELTTILVFLVSDFPPKNEWYIEALPFFVGVYPSQKNE